MEESNENVSTEGTVDNKQVESTVPVEQTVPVDPVQLSSDSNGDSDALKLPDPTLPVSRPTNSSADAEILPATIHENVGHDERSNNESTSEPKATNATTASTGPTQAAKQQAKRFFYKKTTVPPGQQQAGNSGSSFLRRLRPAHYVAGAIILAGIVVLGMTAPHVQSPVVSPIPTVVQEAISPTEPSSTIVTQTPGVKKGMAFLYPNSSLTPGAVLSVTAQQVCQPGYTTKVRSVAEITKNEVFAEYGITTHPTGSYEIDHFIPLELGGSNDITNLWPEPAFPVPGFHQKDIVEDHLHEQVCSGKLSLSQAQQQIIADWFAVYLTIPHTSVTPTGL